MAVPAKKLANGSSVGQLPHELSLEAVRLHAAQLYGRGFRRPAIARALQPYLTSSGDLKQARGKLAKWEKEQAFRDLIWANAVVKLDMESPHILEGITRAAKRGRVDAAKLALSIANRYTDKSDMPSEVVLRIDNGMPRPDERAELHGRQTTHPQLPEASTTDGAI